MRSVTFWHTLLMMFFLTCEHLQAATLHLFAVVDTKATNVENVMVANLLQVQSQFQEISRLAGLDLQETILTGEQAHIQNVLQLIDQLNLNSQDALVFYYSGHGYRTENKVTQWPNLYFSLDQAGLDFEDLILFLKQKAPHFLLAISESCNNVIPSKIAPPLSAFSANLRTLNKHSNELQSYNYKRLFCEFNGHVIIASSSPKEFAYATDQGAFFTQSFFQTLNTLARIEEELTWQDLSIPLGLQLQLKLKQYPSLQRKKQTPLLEIVSKEGLEAKNLPE